jgi:uncharacterized protein YndB with AHSA1/START domain
MTGNYVAEATCEIQAPPSRIWKALIEPKQVKQYFFGTDLQTDWQVGSPISFSGEWEGKPYEDLGTVEAFEPERHLSYTHWSPLSGMPDTLENRHLVSYDLELQDDRTLVTLRQDNNASEEEQRHSQEMWAGVLDSLKEHVEGAPERESAAE